MAKVEASLIGGPVIELVSGRDEKYYEVFCLILIQGLSKLPGKKVNLARAKLSHPSSGFLSAEITQMPRFGRKEAWVSVLLGLRGDRFDFDREHAKKVTLAALS